VWKKKKKAANCLKRPDNAEIRKLGEKKMGFNLEEGTL